MTLEEIRADVARQDARRADFARQFGFVETFANVHPTRVLGKRPGWNQGFGMCETFWHDHPVLWRIPYRRAPVAYQSQPYGWTQDKAREVAAYCEAHGLEWGWTDDPSICWWYPGSTCSVFIFRNAADLPEGLAALLDHAT